MFPRSVIVLKNKNNGINADNIDHLICKYENNCVICLQYYQEPVISYCEHIYCKECIYESMEYTQACPVCKKDISRLYHVDLYIKEEVKDTICLKLLCCEDIVMPNVSEYVKFPFHKVYYCEDRPIESKAKAKEFSSNLFKPKEKLKKTYFYQAVDGQPYYLDKGTLSTLILQEGKQNLPLYIYGQIEEVQEIVLRKDRGGFLSHLMDNSIIYSVKLSINS